MKIIRYSNPQGTIHYGSEQPDGSSFRIDGNIYGDFKVSAERAVITKLLAPIAPAQILCIGLNYGRHADETGAKRPERPILFVKGINALTLQGDEAIGAPLGPRLVTRDEIPNPNALKIATILNGERVQDWTTSDMIFDVPALIAYLSGSTTLVPGTVILTGTPHGVGMAAKPTPRWLRPGDSVSIEIEKIGTLTNPVVLEPV